MTITYVDITTSLGDIVIQLDDDGAPQAVQSFLSYVESSAGGYSYDNSIFDTLVPGDALSGGGYVYNAGVISPNMAGALSENNISSGDPNTVGAVSLYDSVGGASSGAGEFVINLGNGATNGSQEADYAVFGTITAESWPVVEEIASLPVVNLGSPFTSLPVQGSVQEHAISESNLVSITAVAISDTPPCYCRATRIKTPFGYKKIEDLLIGDKVVTWDGREVPVRWLGYRNVNCVSHPNVQDVYPILIAAHAFGQNAPERDLWLSPDHAVLMNNLLIPIKHLTNGRTITQVSVNEVEYWHVEIAHHDVIVAEGLAAESYLDTGNRAAFSNSAVAGKMVAGVEALSWKDACAELVREGPRLVAAKASLFRRAGIRKQVLGTLLAICVDHGSIAATPFGNGTWSCAIPSNTRYLHLCSPTVIPAHCVEESLDHRSLGIRIFDVRIDGRSIALESDFLFSGFHAVEDTREGCCRWTNGDARLVLPIGTLNVIFRTDKDVTMCVLAADNHFGTT